MSSMKEEFIVLLQNCIEYLENTNDNADSFSPIMYHTMAVMHAYTLKESGGQPILPSNRPSFRKENSEDTLASGWIEEMTSASHSSKSKLIVWKSVLALLVHRDEEDPCLWITREIIKSELGDREIETMHRIPMRRLQSVKYVDYHGDHRLTLKVKRRDSLLIFRCQDEFSARQWVKILDQLMQLKSTSKSGSNKESIEMEIDYGHRVNVVHDNDQILPTILKGRSSKSLTSQFRNENDSISTSEDKISNEGSDFTLRSKVKHEPLTNFSRKVTELNLPFDESRRDSLSKTTATDERPLIDLKKGGERVASHSSPLEGLEQNFNDLVTGSNTLTSKREVASQPSITQSFSYDQHQQGKSKDPQFARNLEDEKRRAELEIEHQKRAAAEQRRKELEQQRRLAQEEQKKLEQEERRKFLEKEQRKQELITKAKTGKTAPTTGPVFSGVMDKLNNQLSAWEVAEAERKRSLNEKKKEDEERKKEIEDPETARKRIAEEARQRTVMTDMEQKSVTQDSNGVGMKKVNEERPPQQQATPAPIPTMVAQQKWVQQQSQKPSIQSSTGIGPLPQNPYPQQSYPMQQPWHQAQQTQQQAQMRHDVNHWHRQNPSQGPIPQPNASQLPQQFTPLMPGYMGQQPRFAHPQSQYQGFPGSNVAAPGHRFPSQPTPSQFQGVNQTPNQSSTSHPPSGVGMKYNIMTQQVQDDALSTTALKRNILLNWALQPPTNQVLRPIDQLLCNIHKVFPPTFGVAPHSYFASFQTIVRSDLTEASGTLDKEKLNKSVRKIRFFLHPDRLPRDLNDEQQQFLCKLLWDVTNDAWEDYRKSQEELDWIK
jgi:hypothetical protein